MITEKRLQANRELLIGQKIKRFFPGHGGALGTVKKYSVSNDTYYLTSAHWWSSRVNAFSWYTSSLSDNLTKLKINGNTGKWSRSRLCLVVRVWLILVRSNWNIKLGYLSDITLVLWWKGTFERMISTFWVSKGWFRPFELRKDDFGPFEPFTPTFSHVAVRLASQLTAIPGFFAYDYDTVCAYYQCSCTSTETSLREKRFQDILSRMMSVSSCSTQFMTSSSWRELPTFFAKKCTLKLDLHSLKLMSVAWYWWKVMWRVVQHPSHPRPNRT